MHSIVAGELRAKTTVFNRQPYVITVSENIVGNARARSNRMYYNILIKHSEKIGKLVTALKRMHLNVKSAVDEAVIEWKDVSSPTRHHAGQMILMHAMMRIAQDQRWPVVLSPRQSLATRAIPYLRS